MSAGVCMSEAPLQNLVDDARLAADLAVASTASLHTELLKRGVRRVFMAGVADLARPARRFFGPAVTLRFLPLREDLSSPESVADPAHPQRRAIDTFPAGHVLVVDAMGMQGAGVLGDILAARLQVRGAAAVVTDGAVRDAATLAALDMPMFAGGAAAPAHFATLMAADTGLAIACGGVAVEPGDMIVGDGDGVIVLPRRLAAVVARAAAEREPLEAFLRQRVAAGAALPGTYPPDADTLAAYAAHRAVAGRREE
ncbi:MAG: ribonuclease activity regulator RraA [Alphaproteobacteria bacterium]